jgi:hypothetical protein
MPAANFVAHSRTAPNPFTANHGGGVVYTCHMAAMHWAFMDRGDSQAVANQRVSAVAIGRCPGCNPPGGHVHPSLSYQWYGAHFCAGAQQIATRAALYNAIEVGDVLIAGPNANAPMHTMVVVNKRRMPGHSWVYVRGFNNVGTLGTGPHLQYDAQDRDIDRAALWSGAAAPQTFGVGPGNHLFRIPYNAYYNSAGVVRGQCYGAPVMTYHGT